MINENLNYLWSTGAGVLTKKFSDGEEAKSKSCQQGSRKILKNNLKVLTLSSVFKINSLKYYTVYYYTVN